MPGKPRTGSMAPARPSRIEAAQEVVREIISDFSPDLEKQVNSIISSGLNPTSSLELLTVLVGEAPSASKEAMEKIKLIDTLVKTARSMMETRLKNEEVSAIMRRLDEIESQISLAAQRNSMRPQGVTEVWTRPGDDE